MSYKKEKKGPHTGTPQAGTTKLTPRCRVIRQKRKMIHKVSTLKIINGPTKRVPEYTFKIFVKQVRNFEIIYSRTNTALYLEANLKPEPIY